MIDELKDLNRSFYELFGELHENAALMTERQADFMAAKLFDVYRDEFRRLYLRCEIANKRTEFETMQRRSALIPKSWRFLFLHRENNAAKVIMEQIERETGRFLKACSELFSGDRGEKTSSKLCSETKREEQDESGIAEEDNT